jgi:hypothetical protein
MTPAQAQYLRANLNASTPIFKLWTRTGGAPAALTPMLQDKISNASPPLVNISRRHDQISVMKSA